MLLESDQHWCTTVKVFFQGPLLIPWAAWSLSLPMSKFCWCFSFCHQVLNSVVSWLLWPWWPPITTANRQQIKEGVFPQYLSHEVNPCPGHPQPCHYQVQAPHFPAPLLHRTPPPASILMEEIGWLPGCYFHKTLITGMEHDSDRCTRNFAKFSKDKFTKKELRHLLLRHLQFKRQIYKHLLLACSENQGSCWALRIIENQ